MTSDPFAACLAREYLRHLSTEVSARNYLITWRVLVNEWSLQDTADWADLSRERVRQIVERSLEKMRRLERNASR